jgi:hypothetical protein
MQRVSTPSACLSWLATAAVLCLLTGPAHAFLTEGQIATLAALERGDISLAEVFRLNGFDIDPRTPTEIALGDTLEILFSGSGRSGATQEDAGEAAGFINISFDLAPGVNTATFLVDLKIDVDTTGEDAFAVGGLNFFCAGTWGCAIGDDGTLPDQYGKELTSDTQFGNGTQEFRGGVPDPFMPNSSFGGMETLNFQQEFTIDRALAPSSDTLRWEFGLTYNFGAISSTADVTHTLTITAVPLPGVAWLFGPGLVAGLAWMRRQQRLRAP